MQNVNRKCKVCGEEKPLNQFAKNKICLLGYEHTCRKCATQRAILWERTSRASRKEIYLKYTYGITLKDYEEMRIKQDSKCKICKQSEVVLDKKYGQLRDLSVDHCHTTGKIRGLLCTRCNTAIGSFRDDIDFLKSAIKYLKKAKVS